MEILGKVRRMHLRDKLSLHEVSKCTGLSRNTLRKWLRQPEEAVVAPSSYHRDAVTTKLTVCHTSLELALEVDALHIMQNRRTGKTLFLQTVTSNEPAPDRVDLHSIATNQQ